MQVTRHLNLYLSFSIMTMALILFSPFKAYSQGWEAAAITYLGEEAKKIDWKNVERALKKFFNDSDKYASKNDEYIFFEGNHCTQNIVGSMHTSDHMREEIQPQKNQNFKNDEARSVLVQKANKCEVLHVYNHPSGHFSNKGHSWIRFDRDVTTPICIGTFERNYRYMNGKNYGGITMGYDKKGKVDGKISNIRNYVSPTKNEFLGKHENTRGVPEECKNKHR